jgi:hypothetical protein
LWLSISYYTSLNGGCIVQLLEAPVIDYSENDEPRNQR